VRKKKPYLFLKEPISFVIFSNDPIIDFALFKSLSPSLENIGKVEHLKKIFSEGKLDENSVCRDFRHTAKEATIQKFRIVQKERAV
jgi:hypothetical protein